jgi:hypothetical protein
VIAITPIPKSTSFSIINQKELITDILDNIKEISIHGKRNFTNQKTHIGLLLKLTRKDIDALGIRPMPSTFSDTFMSFERLFGELESEFTKELLDHSSWVSKLTKIGAQLSERQHLV